MAVAAFLSVPVDKESSLCLSVKMMKILITMKLISHCSVSWFTVTAVSLSLWIHISTLALRA